MVSVTFSVIYRRTVIEAIKGFHSRRVSFRAFFHTIMEQERFFNFSIFSHGRFYIRISLFSPEY